MKGERLIIKLLIYTSLALIVTMVVLNLYPSWSQYARSAEEPLLLATLSAISSVFLIRSFTHPNRDKILFKPLNIDFRVEHANRYAGFFFIGVLCTPVTHPEPFIQYLHFAFTGLAILFAHLELWFYYKNDIAKIGSALGILGFLLAFVFRLYTVGLGELLAALPIVIHILKSNKYD